MLSPERKIIAIGPAGEWGSAVAIVAAYRGHNVRILLRNPEDVQIFQRTRRTKHLPGEDMPSNVQAFSDRKKFVDGADLLVLAPPSQQFRPFSRDVISLADPRIPRLILTKGLEQVTNLRMSQILLEDDPTSIDQIAVLSGPTLAKEVARSLTRGVALPEISGAVVAAYNPDLTDLIQSWLTSDRFRIYTSDDPIGVELGGALKNIMGLGAGMAEELNVPSNSRALFFTRALEEIARFITTLGGHDVTIRGLAVVGDLLLSFDGRNGGATRNYRAGVRLAKGYSVDEVLDIELAEGLYTLHSAIDLAKIHNIDAPITSALYNVIYGGLDIRTGISQLIDRQPTREQLVDKGLRFRLARLVMRALHKVGRRSLI